MNMTTLSWTCKSRILLLHGALLRQSGHRSIVGSSVAEGASHDNIPRQVAVVGAQGLVRRGFQVVDTATSGASSSPSTTGMIGQVLSRALDEAQLTTSDLDGVVAVPSLAKSHFMEAHYHATALGLFNDDNGKSFGRPRSLRCRTLDTGGAGPVSALLEAKRMILMESSPLECVAVLAADAVGSMSSLAFLQKADGIFFQLANDMGWPPGSVVSPAIPHGYDQITQYQLEHYPGTFNRRQLKMAVCLESFHAGLHPQSLQSQKARTMKRKQQQQQQQQQLYSYTTLEQVERSPAVTPNISLLECARRADGAACLILASNRFLQRKGLWKEGLPVIIGSGESSGPLYPPRGNNNNDDDDGDGGISKFTYSSCHEAMTNAYMSAGSLSHEDIDFFGLYDCFPICLVRAIEACGLAWEGEGGRYLEEHYDRMMMALSDGDVQTATQRLLDDPTWFPINCHGGLLCFGAPWEVPAMYNIIEAVDQLRGQAKGRQLPNPRRALVYGNGGVLSASAVAILAKSQTDGPMS